MTHASPAYGIMYHEVADHPDTSGLQRPAARPYRLSVDAFRRHLDVLAEANVRPALVTDPPSRDDGAARVFLTFDDGGRSALTAAELLSDRGWRGHFFIVTGWIGRRGFLDADGVRTLHAMGHVVGSHSVTHPDIFRDLPPSAMRDEWRVSCARLREVTGAPCRAGSVPGGDSSRPVFAAAADVGLRWLFTSEPWRRPRDVRGCRVYGRLIVKDDMPLARLRALLSGRGWMGVLLRRRGKGLARRILAPLYRRYVTHQTGRGGERP